MTAALHLAVVSGAAMLLYLFCLAPAHARVLGNRVIGAAVAMPIIAWALPDARLLYAVMLFWVPLVSGRSDRIAPVYLFSLLLLPGLDAPAAAGAIKLFDFGVHDALGLGAAAALLADRRRAHPRAMFDVAAIGIILLLVAALARGATPTHFLRVAINIMFDLGLPYFIVSRGITTLGAMRDMRLWLGAGAVALAAILLYEVSRAWPIYNQLYVNYMVPIDYFVKSRGGLLRAAGPFLESTSAAFVMAICTYALWLARDAFRSRFHHLLVLAIAIIGLMAPQSRGAWMGLLLAVVVAMAYRGQYLRIVRLALLAGGAWLALTIAAQTSATLSESLGLSGASSETSDYRRMLLTRGLEEFRDSPVFGFALRDITERLSDLRQGEGIVDFVNAYLWVLLISGIAGFTLFVSCYGLFIGQALGQRRWSARSNERMDAACFALGGLAMAASMLVFTAFNARPAVFVFALFGTVAALVAIRDRNPVITMVESKSGTEPSTVDLPAQTKWAWRTR
ncbi:O-antigen ligase family protein [Sphingomonas sp. AX6]|uniref:O-antigen ligase family protein n=1 Tax=Sphingomonas sp. AX6 TaxID=2653171 RepID=UPI0012EFA3A2|nr:O-antigen ligase family protein [Sphingomonas sp. AX6]VXC98747.1 conserved membrane hypothetical protein [Sphingomonas sp. AX6]